MSRRSNGSPRASLQLLNICPFSWVIGCWSVLKNSLKGRSHGYAVATGQSETKFQFPGSV